MTRSTCLAGLGLIFAVAANADDARPNHPNLLVVTLEGAAGVGVPARGLEDVLPDPEIRARVTPDAERLAESGARFENAFAGGDAAASDLEDAFAHLRLKAGYEAGFVSPAEQAIPAYQDERGTWSVPQRQQPLSRWIKRTPDEQTIAAWEQLADTQDAPLTAVAAVEALRRPTDERPQALAVRLSNGSPSPIIPGIFFDRFPIDQIELPKGANARQALAARMGVYDLELEGLDAEDEAAWKRAIQAWLAKASALDYAAGKLIDAVAELNGDDDPANDWALVIAALPSAERGGVRAVQEIGARADVLAFAPGVTKPKQRVVTPVDLSDLPLGIIELAGIDPLPLDELRLEEGRPVDFASRRALSQLAGNGLRDLLAPAGERYDRVAITSAGDTHGVRSHRFRLVQAEDGSQSLYDLAIDPVGSVDLLEPANASSIETFGLSQSQVESVRKWLAGLLTHHLIVEQGNGDRHRPTIGRLKQAGIFPKAPGPNRVIPGDFNRDGVVNAADKTVWADKLDQEVPRPGDGADANHDGRVDQQDDEVWRANYGRRAG